MQARGPKFAYESRAAAPKREAAPAAAATPSLPKKRKLIRVLVDSSGSEAEHDEAHTNGGATRGGGATKTPTASTAPPADTDTEVPAAAPAPPPSDADAPGRQGPIAAGDVGSRVVVSGYAAHGTLRFFGPHAVEGTLRCGVELDKPLGKNDGTVKGHTYFACRVGHGILIKPPKVTRAQAKHPRIDRDQSTHPSGH